MEKESKVLQDNETWYLTDLSFGKDPLDVNYVCVCARTL